MQEVDILFIFVAFTCTVFLFMNLTVKSTGEHTCVLPMLRMALTGIYTAIVMRMLIFDFHVTINIFSLNGLMTIYHNPYMICAVIIHICVGDLDTVHRLKALNPSNLVVHLICVILLILWSPILSFALDVWALLQ